MDQSFVSIYLSLYFFIPFQKLECSSVARDAKRLKELAFLDFSRFPSQENLDIPERRKYLYVASGVENDPRLYSNFSNSCCFSGQKSQTTHLQNPCKHTNSLILSLSFFFFSLRNITMFWKGHGEHFLPKVENFVTFFQDYHALPLALSSDFTHFYREQIGNFDTFIKVYRRFFFVVLHFVWYF